MDEVQLQPGEKIWVPERNGMMWPKCYKCNTTWRQSGNRTGHCSNCHRTFDGIYAFDRHQTISGGNLTCHDPLTISDDYKIRIGEGVFDKDTVYYGLQSRESVDEMKARLNR